MSRLSGVILVLTFGMGMNSFASSDDTNPAAVGFIHYFKCGNHDSSEANSLGDPGSAKACLDACRAAGVGFGCWYLDGTDGFPRDCRVCTLQAPAYGGWSNDWAQPNYR